MIPSACEQTTVSSNDRSENTPQYKSTPCVHWAWAFTGSLERGWRQLSVTQASHREDSPEALRVYRADQGSVTPHVSLISDFPLPAPPCLCRPCLRTAP